MGAACGAGVVDRLFRKPGGGRSRAERGRVAGETPGPEEGKDREEGKGRMREEGKEERKEEEGRAGECDS
jgi:hypothetical protein